MAQIIIEDADANVTVETVTPTIDVSVDDKPDIKVESPTVGVDVQVAVNEVTIEPVYPTIEVATTTADIGVTTLDQTIEVQLSGARGPTGPTGPTGPSVTGPTGPIGIGDHGALTGLLDDDHPQYINESGDAMTGYLTLHANPIASNQAANKGYVDLKTATRIIFFPTPMSSWFIDSDHLINVVVVDSANHVVEPGGIIYQGTNITLQFSAAFSGTAYCF